VPWAAVGVQRHGHRHHFSRIDLSAGGAHLGDGHGQAARRRKAVAARRFEPAAALQAVDDAVGEGIAQLGQRLGRQFFGDSSTRSV
jgi:hypothetical protein